MVANLTVRILDRQLAGGNPFMNSSPGLVELKYVSDASRVTDQHQTAPCCPENQIQYFHTHDQLLGVNDQGVFMRVTHEGSKHSL